MRGRAMICRQVMTTANRQPARRKTSRTQVLRLLTCCRHHSTAMGFMKSSRDTADRSFPSRPQAVTAAAQPTIPGAWLRTPPPPPAAAPPPPHPVASTSLSHTAVSGAPRRHTAMAPCCARSSCTAQPTWRSANVLRCCKRQPCTRPRPLLAMSSFAHNSATGVLGLAGDKLVALGDKCTSAEALPQEPRGGDWAAKHTGTTALNHALCTPTPPPATHWHDSTVPRTADGQSSMQ